MTSTRDGGLGQQARAFVNHIRTSGPPSVTLADRATVNGAMSYFWGAGGGLVLLSVLLGRSPRTNIAGVIAVAIAALTVCAVFQLCKHRLPPVILPPVVSLGSVAVTLVAAFDGSHPSPYALFYVFAALYACYFFSLRALIGQVAIIAVLSAIVLGAHHSAVAGLGDWVVLMGVVSVSAWWVRYLVSEVRTAAGTDGLTGAVNRHQLEWELPRILSHAARTGEPVAVAMFDLDNFKQYNDTAGHLAGDRLLVTAAKRWREQLRSGDLLVRYGGEEFLAVLPACAVPRAASVVERIRAMTPEDQTCSAGVAIWDRHEKATSLLLRADRALYVAKRHGRNRAVVDWEEIEAPHCPEDPATAEREAAAIGARARILQIVQPPSTTRTEPVT